MAKKEKRPIWYHLFAEDLYHILDVENLDSDPDFVNNPRRKDQLFNDLGRALLNSLIYFKDYYEYGGEDPQAEYPIESRDGRIVYNALKRGIVYSYEEYEERVENGKKGGRPLKEENENSDNNHE